MIKKILLFFNIIKQNYTLSDAERVRLAALNAKDRIEERDRNYKPEKDPKNLDFYGKTVKEILLYYKGNNEIYSPTYKVNIPVELNSSNVVALFREKGFDVELNIQPIGAMDYLIFDFSKPRLADNYMVKNPRLRFYN